MDNKNQEKSGFTYTYSAREQEEIKRIREKYEQKSETEDKMARLRRLDASVTTVAQIAALIFGVVGILILGFGMSLVMTELSDAFGFDEATAMLVGASIGVFGGILASLAYPVYNLIAKHRREKIAPEIIHLTDELMK